MRNMFFGMLLALCSAAWCGVDLLRSVPAIPDQAPQGEVNVVIEIPAGTAQKWEVRKSDGQLVWTRTDQGRRRIIQYLPYPVNYGFIPRTLLSHKDGGDGDAIDVLFLGPAVSRGAVMTGYLVGVLKLLDGTEQDHKLMVVPASGPFAGIRSLSKLQKKFPGVLQILKTWFLHYKGPDHMKFMGWGDAAQARTWLARAQRAYHPPL